MRLVAAFCLFFIHFFVTPPSTHASLSSDLGTIRVVERSIKSIYQQHRRRPHRLKNMNDSFQLMGVAAGMIVTQAGDPSDIEQRLNESIRAYKGNSFAYLMRALSQDLQGKSDMARVSLYQFLDKSTSYTDFEEPFIKAGDLKRLRAAVYDFLDAQGIELEDREEALTKEAPYRQLMRELMSLNDVDNATHMILMITLLIGGILILGGNMMGMEFSHPVARVLTPTYTFVWVAYGLWLCDLAMGLPFGWERTKVVPITIGSVFLLNLGLQLIEYYRQENLPLEEGYKRCPYCREVVQQLTIECPKCKKRLTTGD